MADFRFLSQEREADSPVIAMGLHELKTWEPLSLSHGKKGSIMGHSFKTPWLVEAFSGVKAR